MASFKKKLLKKYTDETTPYSPSKLCSRININNQSMDSFGNPESPLSTNSLVFDGNNWVMNLDEDDVNPRNFCPPKTSSPVPSSKFSFNHKENKANKFLKSYPFIFNHIHLLKFNLIIIII